MLRNKSRRKRYCKGQTNDSKEFKMAGKGKRYYRRKEQVHRKKKRLSGNQQIIEMEERKST